jgi:hypothetical protein
MPEKFELPNGYAIEPTGVDILPGIPGTYNGASLTIVIPVYNNGRHLEFKALMSLKRKSFFARMEILIADMHSTDVETTGIVLRLARNYGNITSLRLSRDELPGVLLSVKTDYVTFLHPENECLFDAYADLTEKLNASGAPFVSYGFKLFAPNTTEPCVTRVLERLCEGNAHLFVMRADFARKYEITLAPESYNRWGYLSLLFKTRGFIERKDIHAYCASPEDIVPLALPAYLRGSRLPKTPLPARAALISWQYPSNTDLYKYGFVHTRVTAYQKNGYHIRVIRCDNDQSLSVSEFDGVGVISATPNNCAA